MQQFLPSSGDETQSHFSRHLLYLDTETRASVAAQMILRLRNSDTVALAAAAAVASNQVSTLHQLVTASTPTCVAVSYYSLISCRLQPILLYFLLNYLIILCRNFATFNTLGSTNHFHVGNFLVDK